MNETPATPSADPSEPSGPETAADPFEPGPAQLSGCGKPAVIGCVVLLVVFAVGMIVLLSQSPKLLRFLIRAMQTEVTAALPEDLDEVERQRLAVGFDAAIAAVSEGRLDASSTTNLQRLSRMMPARGETLSRDEVEEIVRVLEEIGAVNAPSARRPIPRGPPAAAIPLSP